MTNRRNQKSCSKYNMQELNQRIKFLENDTFYSHLFSSYGIVSNLKRSKFEIPVFFFFLINEKNINNIEQNRLYLFKSGFRRN